MVRFRTSGPTRRYTAVLSVSVTGWAEYMRRAILSEKKYPTKFIRKAIPRPM